MSEPLVSAKGCGNKLLAMLPAKEYESIHPYLELVEMPARCIVGKRAHSAEFVYFPVTAVFSILATMQRGMAVEVGTIGNEGFVGIAVLLDEDLPIETTICQVGGKACECAPGISKKQSLPMKV
jgi:hypothetical protein